MSDSPGLLRLVGREATRRVKADAPSRSWMSPDAVKFATLDDVVIAGASRRLYVASQDANLIEFWCLSMTPCQCSLVGKGGGARDPNQAERPVIQWSSFYRPVRGAS